MIDQARRDVSKFLAFCAAITFAVAASVSPAAAQGLFNQIRYAAIVVDASSGEVLYAKRADDLRYPASITKIMTLYLTFEALSTGRLKPTDRVLVSDHAYNMAPSKSTLRPGETLSVDDAMRIVAVHSANDIAVALAEKIGGSESRFAALMTLRAQELGMANTRFVNAHGLPDSRQVTTARDFAILARAVMRDYPQYFTYFGLRDCVVAGKLYENHNHLLREPGYDGFKTGFTNAAGYNLVASAVRDDRRLITVVLGGSSAALRDENVQTLMNAGFDVLRKRAFGERTTIAANIAEPDDSGPIQQSIEQGDGGRGGLSAVVVDSLHGPQSGQLAEEERESTVTPPPPGLRGRVAVARAAEPCVAVSHHRGRTIRRAVACRSERVQVATADCFSLHGKARRLCDRREAAVLATASEGKGRHGRREIVTLAKAAPAKAKARHAHHHRAEA
jgi:D-alanyl-D-alanine carboxypeptidase (penicillin-binding protein 5/6)